MPEQSHLDEMRDAIRGDFERLAERRGEQELLRVGEPDSEAEPPALDAAEPQPQPESEAEPEPEHEAELEPERDAEPEPDAEPRRSWLTRLLSP